MSGLFVSSLHPARLSYYFSGVATGIEDCRPRLEEGEITYLGGWLHRPNDERGLEELFRELKNLGKDPRFVRPIKNVAYDLCWVAPKQLSILFGLLPEPESSQVAEAHAKAIAGCLEAMHSRVVRDGRGKISAVAFLHLTSRSLDPHLHSHVILANRVELDDGSCRAVDSTNIYRNSTEWSLLYRRLVAEEVRDRLGVVMIERGLTEPGGPTEVPGFPKGLATVFSKRSLQVSDLAGRWGASGRGASRRASLMTRADKTVMGPRELRERWASELEDAGFTVRQLEDLLPRVRRTSRSFSLIRRIDDSSRAEESLFRRVTSPGRAEGSVKLVSFEDDLYQRMHAFTLGRVIGAIAGRKDIDIGGRSGNRLSPAEPISETVELIALGRVDLPKIAESAFHYRHHDLVIALQAGSSLQSDNFGEVRPTPVVEMVERVGSNCHLDLKAESRAGLDISKPSIAALERSMNRTEAILSDLKPGDDMHSFLVLASKRDRDLARAVIADHLRLATGLQGFHHSEPVWIHYLPRGVSFGDARIGWIDLHAEKLRFSVDRTAVSVPLSRINAETMISPLSVMSWGDARRAFGAHFNFSLDLGEFARYDISCDRTEIFSNRVNLVTGKCLNLERDVFAELEEPFLHRDRKFPFGEIYR